MMKNILKEKSVMLFPFLLLCIVHKNLLAGAAFVQGKAEIEGLGVPARTQTI
jgi:hypothetical protein